METTNSKSLFSVIFSTLKSLLPAIIPSWNFFDYIAPSPRAQFALLHSEDGLPSKWHEYCPQPDYISFITMLKRMFWNSQWNESLYVMSCAERLMDKPTHHSEDEILNCIKQYVIANNQKYNLENIKHLQFRLVFIKRQGEELQHEVTFLSRIAAFSNQSTVKTP